jgi:hypothetical protein
MSPQAGCLLLEEIAPRLRSAIPRVVKPVGAEDEEELVQDAIVTAAQMLASVERNGKKVTPGNIAYYTILHMKSGRRSQCRSRADTMANGTQLDHKSCVLSFEEEVGFDPELDEPVTLGELLACHHDDPAMSGARNIDWDAFLGSHDYRYTVIVKGIVEGRNLRETATGAGSGYSRLYQLKEQMADDLREFMGSSAIEDSAKLPQWRGNLMADRERAACQADRRRN